MLHYTLSEIIIMCSHDFKVLFIDFLITLLGMQVVQQGSQMLPRAHSA